MELFFTNKYTRWYYSIVERAKLRPINSTDYYERHHIIPKTLGGSNKHENLVLLTAREHYIAHLLLMKMCISKRHQFQMSSAFDYMSNVRNDYTNQRYNSRLFEYHKLLRRRIRSERMAGNKNPMHGKQRTKEWKQKYSEMRKGWKTNTIESNERKRMKWTENNPNYDLVAKAKAVEKLSHTWILTSPSGEEIYVKNLAKFCRENNLSDSNLNSVAHGKLGHYKGWKARRAT